MYESAQKVEGTIDSVIANMYELYSYDTNFKALETARGIDCLTYGYQLSDQLKALELYEKRNVSYMLYYDDMAYRKYYFNQGLYSNADIEAIKETMDVLVDTRLLVKPVKSAISYMPTAPYELPYEGAKEMLLVDEVDNKEFLTGLFHAMYDELPALKPKKKK